MLWFSLPLGTATNSVAGPADWEATLESLISSVDLLGVYFFDQSEYLLSGLEGIEQNTRYFWIFRNLDYEKWMKREVEILALRGPFENLEHAASHIARSLQNLDTSSQGGHVLYFSFNSIRDELGPQDAISWHDLASVWNLLRQIIGNSPTTLQKSLLRAFLGKALHSLSDDDLAKLRGYNSTGAFKSLLHLSKPQDLWDALGRALSEIANLGKQEYPRRWRKPNLTIVIDLDPMVSTWKTLIGNIRQMATALRQDYRTVRVLLSNVPEINDPWQPRQSEVLLEYDKERVCIAHIPKLIQRLLWALIRFPIFWIR